MKQSPLQLAYPNLGHVLAEEQKLWDKHDKERGKPDFLSLLTVAVTDLNDLTVVFHKRVSKALEGEEVATRAYAEKKACELLRIAKWPTPDALVAETMKSLEKDENNHYLPYQRPEWDREVTMQDIKGVDFWYSELT